MHNKALLFESLVLDYLVIIMFAFKATGQLLNKNGDVIFDGVCLDSTFIFNVLLPKILLKSVATCKKHAPNNLQLQSLQCFVLLVLQTWTHKKCSNVFAIKQSSGLYYMHIYITIHLFENVILIYFAVDRLHMHFNNAAHFKILCTFCDETISC